MSFLHILKRSSRYPQSSWSWKRYASNATPAVAKQTNKKLTTTTTGAVPVSSCSADTVLTGLNYLKGQPQVLALSDDQYPDWLWTILQPKVYPDDGPGEKAERVKRRAENRQRIKDRNFMQTQ